MKSDDGSTVQFSFFGAKKYLSAEPADSSSQPQTPADESASYAARLNSSTGGMFKKRCVWTQGFTSAQEAHGLELGSEDLKAAGYNQTQSSTILRLSKAYAPEPSSQPDSRASYLQLARSTKISHSKDDAKARMFEPRPVDHESDDEPWEKDLEFCDYCYST